MGVTPKLGNLGAVTTTLEEAVNWARTGATWPLLFGLACCAIEFMSTGATPYDFDRFGITPRASPRQADVMVIAGTAGMNFFWTGVSRYCKIICGGQDMISSNRCAVPFQ